MEEVIQMAASSFRCIACEQPEDKCACDRYCALCHSEYDARLCEDGQYYCADCREACDFAIQA